jgi:hypothetical protein
MKMLAEKRTERKAQAEHAGQEDQDEVAVEG